MTGIRINRNPSVLVIDNDCLDKVITTCEMCAHMTHSYGTPQSAFFLII